jgi:hypothetical protein
VRLWFESNQTKYAPRKRGAYLGLVITLLCRSPSTTYFTIHAPRDRLKDGRAFSHGFLVLVHWLNDGNDTILPSNLIESCNDVFGRFSLNLRHTKDSHVLFVRQMLAYPRIMMNQLMTQYH